MQLDLLLFSVGGVRFAVETGLIAGIAAYNGETSEGLFWFHEEMDYGENRVDYTSPFILTIKSEAAVPYRIIIDSMEDIAEFSTGDIRLLPPLMEPLLIKKGIWGLLLINEGVILLLDIARLIMNKYR